MDHSYHTQRQSAPSPDWETMLEKLASYRLRTSKRAPSELDQAARAEIDQHLPKGPSHTKLAQDTQNERVLASPARSPSESIQTKRKRRDSSGRSPARPSELAHSHSNLDALYASKTMTRPSFLSTPKHTQDYLANDRSYYPQQSSDFAFRFPSVQQSIVFERESSAFHPKSTAFDAQDYLDSGFDDEMLFEKENRALPDPPREGPSREVPSYAAPVFTKLRQAPKAEPARRANQPASDASDSDGDSESRPAEGRPVQAHQAKRRTPRRSGLSKKRRQAADLPLRVWLNSRWTHIEDLAGDEVGVGLQAAFEDLASPKSTRDLWARWTDPDVLPTHYEQCIGHGLNAKAGRAYPQNHRACDWCVKTGRLCAVLHAGIPSAFVGILPRKRELRVGCEPSEIAYWLGD